MLLRVSCPTDVLELGTSFYAAKVLLAAVELGVFEALADGPLPARRLHTECGLHPRTARDFLDVLVSLGLLERSDILQPQPVYALTPVAEAGLVRGRPEYVGDFLTLADRRSYPLWGHLTDTLRTGEPGPGLDDRDLFDAVYADPKQASIYPAAMSSLSAPAIVALAEVFPWADQRTVCDVGASRGALLVHLTRRFPQLEGLGFDLPDVAPMFAEYVEQAGVGERVRFVPGDFFADQLPSADVLVMGHILHDWNLETKRMLLDKAHKALRPDGTLVIYETLIDDERRSNTFGLLMSLHMALRTRGGFDYTAADARSWLLDAGFRDVRVQHLVGAHSALIATA
ncbi:acetylserotonin O-methyltransferase [Streptacidiphilus pinicola]|uniref:acetylserotonin O-methyltransferase n=1 Tax=Streptacidiphilus pinicola TaxID=2219663 RepID=UPI001FB40F04|nr:acetylserotonin O-methyltransferase [Streptacidiphilus pinicola]